MTNYNGWFKAQYFNVPIETYSERTIDILMTLLPFYKRFTTKATNFRRDPAWRRQFEKDDEKCIVSEKSIKVIQLDEAGNKCGEDITTLRDPGCEERASHLENAELLSDFISNRTSVWDSYFTGDFVKMPEMQNKYAFNFIHIGSPTDNEVTAAKREVRETLNFLSMVITVLQTKLDKDVKSLKFVTTEDIVKYVRKGLQRTVLSHAEKELTLSIEELIAFKNFIKFIPKKLKETSSSVKEFKEAFGAERYAAFCGVPENDPFKLSTSSIIQNDYFSKLIAAIEEENVTELPNLVYF